MNIGPAIIGQPGQDRANPLLGHGLWQVSGCAGVELWHTVRPLIPHPPWCRRDSSTKRYWEGGGSLQVLPALTPLSWPQAPQPPKGETRQRPGILVHAELSLVKLKRTTVCTVGPHGSRYSWAAHGASARSQVKIHPSPSWGAEWFKPWLTTPKAASKGRLDSASYRPHPETPQPFPKGKRLPCFQG